MSSRPKLPKVRKDALVYRDPGDNYSAETMSERRRRLEEACGIKLKHVASPLLVGDAYKGNIENPIGSAQLPLGVGGPIQVNGEFAQGQFYVPFATTEGAIVDSYMRGMLALTKAGGANTRILKDIMHITPMFQFDTLEIAVGFTQWVALNFTQIKAVAEQGTSNGKLIQIEPTLTGNRVFLKFIFTTNDAMGLNMVNIATHRACEFLVTDAPFSFKYYLRVNFSADKKASAANFAIGYGKEVQVDCTLPAAVVSRMLQVTPEQLRDFWAASVLGSMQAGILGLNAHLANGMAAIYIATGQDVAQITSSAVGVTAYDVTATGDLHATLRLPNLLVGTVGGGTWLPTQKECLELMGCHGPGKVKKFAEIVAATLLAGELSISSALANGAFVNIHKAKHAHTRNK